MFYVYVLHSQSDHGLYIGYSADLRRRIAEHGRGGVTVQSARDFVQWATQEKQPRPWQVEQWKEAIRWFFRGAKRSVQSSPQDSSLHEEAPVWLPEEKTQWPEWKLAFLTVVRRRKYSIRTEQSWWKRR